VIDQFETFFRTKFEILESESLVIRDKDIAQGRNPLVSSGVFTRLEPLDA
jgi:hypothetical protein